MVRRGGTRTPWVVRALLVVVLLELFLLGSGRLLEVGPITVRMLLYAAGVAYACVYYAWRGAADREVVGLGFAFVTLQLFSLLFGVMRGASLGAIAADLQPLSFFLALSFFSATIRDLAQVRRVAFMVKVSAVILAVGYLIVIALLKSGVIPFLPFYLLMNSTGEFMFRGSIGMVYKGFLYLGVGFFFFAFDRRLAHKAIAALLLVALILTFTRGFLLSLAVVFIGALLLTERRKHLSLMYAMLALAGFALLWPWFARALMDRADADTMRMLDLKYVLDSITWYSLAVGHGFGSTIGYRLRIEATYFEILHKQGVLGLLFWGGLLMVILRRFLISLRKGNGNAALPFFLATLFVYLQSATNPFLTNPIGMSMVLLALVALGVLARTPARA